MTKSLEKKKNYSTYNTRLINILIDLVINVEISIKNRFNFWFEIFDKNENILITRSNIDFKYIIEHDDNYVNLIYKFIYRFHKQFNEQSRIAINDFFV